MARLSLLLLSDGRFPAGGYAHSGGLEPAVADGLGVADLPRGPPPRPECMLMLQAARAARAGDLDALRRLDAESEARTPSPPLRTASRRLGAQLLRTACTVWPQQALIAAYRAASAATPRPVAFGVVAAATGLDDLDAAQAYLYEEAATLSGAAARLLPIDAADALRLLADTEPTLIRLAEEVVSSRHPPAELPSAFAPCHELRSLAHSGREGRLFAT